MWSETQIMTSGLNFSFPISWLHCYCVGFISGKLLAWDGKMVSTVLHPISFWVQSQLKRSLFPWLIVIRQIWSNYLRWTNHCDQGMEFQHLASPGHMLQSWWRDGTHLLHMDQEQEEFLTGHQSEVTKRRGNGYVPNNQKATGGLHGAIIICIS